MQRVFRFTFRTQKVLATSVCALMLAAACSDPVTPSDKPGLLSRVSSLRTLPTVELNARRGLYLTYGQPVPEGQIVDRLPEPYDVRKHGRPRTSDEVGVPAQHSRSYIRSKDPRRSAIAPNLGATDAHAGIFLTSEHRGIYGLMDVRSDVDIPTGWLDTLVYAPTNMPGGGSCIEVTTIHWRGADWNHTFNDALGVWDWCNDIAFVNFWTFTSTFKSKYVRRVTDEWGTPREKYYLVIVADDVDGAYQSYDTWRFFLYNYNTGLYDQMWAIAGELGQTVAGWSMYESYRMQGYYGGGSCMSLPTIRSLGLNVRLSDGSWVPPTSSVRSSAGVQDGTCFLNSSYTLYIDQYTDGDWWAWTPSNSY